MISLYFSRDSLRRRLRRENEYITQIEVHTQSRFFLLFIVFIAPHSLEIKKKILNFLFRISSIEGDFFAAAAAAVFLETCTCMYEHFFYYIHSIYVGGRLKILN